ncbi:hypothetical protein ACFP3I_24450 [Chryseobacterium arachidis]
MIGLRKYLIALTKCLIDLSYQLNATTKWFLGLCWKLWLFLEPTTQKFL